MSHIYKCAEWQGGDGNWYVNDVTDGNSVAIKWYTPARMLNMALTDYIHMLLKKFNAKIEKYNDVTEVLIFYFVTQAEARQFKNYINRKAREIQFQV